MKTFCLILMGAFFLTNSFAQDLESGGANSWVFHTPDDGRTIMFVAPKIDGSYAWGNATQFWNNGNVVFNGNVGIGTTTPNSKLAVNGNIRAHEIKVETANWPDYVFAKDYQLPTLQETEKHIKEQGHLPGIPSAAEVKANGIDLGEMNAKLLQKIEELTLHLIEMKKENVSQNKRLEAQQKEINTLKSTLSSKLN